MTPRGVTRSARMPRAPGLQFTQIMFDESDPLLTTHQVAQLLGVHSFTVARHIDQGLLEGFRTPGGHRRLRASEVRRFLLSRGMPIPKELAMGDAPLRIVAVDDEPQVLSALRRALRPHAATVSLTTTTSPIEALLMVGLSTPDVLLFDLQMPHLHGIELCMTVRATAALRGVRLLAMTAYTDPEVMAAVVQAGAEVCFEKPVTVEMLLSRLLPALPSPR